MRILAATWAALWRMLAFFGVWALLLAAAILPARGLLARRPGEGFQGGQLYGDAVALVAILLASGFMMRIVERQPLGELGLTGGVPRAARGLVLGALAGAAWLGASLGLAALGGWVTYAPAGRISAAGLALAGLSLLMNVATQQLLLNGYLLRTLRRRAGTVAAILVSAALFCSYHAGAFHGQWLAALNVFAAGVLFCLVFRLVGRLWLPIGIHFAWDFLLGTALGLEVSGTGRLGAGWRLLEIRGPALFTGGPFGLEGGLAVTITAAAGVALLLWRLRHHKEVAPCPPSPVPPPAISLPSTPATSS